MIKGMLILMLFFSFLFSKDFSEEAIKMGTGQASVDLIIDRESDTDFKYTDTFCCCSERILSVFKADTKSQTNKVNLGEDLLLASLTLMKERVDMKVKELKNWKIANGIYSFSDRTNSSDKYSSSSSSVDANTDVDKHGCKELDYNSAEDREWYQTNIIDKFEAGGDYSTEGQRSNAFGRYQFMPDTGAEYCAQASSVLSGVNCCGGDYVLHYGSSAGQITGGAEWRTGANAEICQDTMMRLLTTNNFNSLGAQGIAQNSCTLYLSHQLGLGGLGWLNGGANPYSDVANVVEKNVGADVWSEAISSGLDVGNEEQLRQLYINYWNDKLGGDIFSGSGKSPISVDNVLQNTALFENIKINRDKFWRKGIILEMFYEKSLLENILQQLETEQDKIISGS